MSLTDPDLKNGHPYIPQRLAVKSMRDSGYKNTAYALAELIDNSYQAIEEVRALDPAYPGVIEVVVVEEWETVRQRGRYRAKFIAVADNGCGMSPEVLRKALQFGNGTHLDDRDGIGRFGMGLPNSTVSQCRRADVWTWQTGHANAVSSYLDLDMIERDEVHEVPLPVASPLPSEWIDRIPMLGEAESGTLVVWSELDRVMWRSAKSTLDNTEYLIGRIYRKLLNRGLVLKLTAVRNGDRDTRLVRPNDPLYLTANTSTPEPFDKEPMFQPHGRDGRQRFPIEFRGETHDVVITLSYARDEARLLPDLSNPGDKPYGKHARENVGVSVVRADRELTLETAWATRDLRERWWGAEICFPPALDEVFGVTNNKQFATHFAEMAQYYRDDRNNDEWQEIRNEWEEDGDPRLHLINICNWLHTQLQMLRDILREQTKGVRSKKKQRHDERVEKAASRAFKERAVGGYDAGKADEEPAPEEKRAAVETDLRDDKNYTKDAARELAEYVVSEDIRVMFVQKNNPEQDAFFHPCVLPGVTEVVFNTAHPVFDRLIAVLDPDVGAESADRLRSRLQASSDTLKLLLSAWARYEAEEKAGPRRDMVKSARQQWGRMARSFLRDFEAGDIDRGDDGE